jgi:hypothetical protein
MADGHVRDTAAGAYVAEPVSDTDVTDVTDADAGERQRARRESS